MLSSLKALDYFQEIKLKINCDVTMDVKFSKDLILWVVWLILLFWNYGFLHASPFPDVLVAVIYQLLMIVYKRTFQNKFVVPTA